MLVVDSCGMNPETSNSHNQVPYGVIWTYGASGCFRMFRVLVQDHSPATGGVP